MIALILLFSAGLLCIFFGFRGLKHKRRIENLATSKTRSVAMGLVEVAGKAKSIKLLTEPLTKSQCVYYSSIVEHEVTTTRNGKSETRWEKIFEESSTQPFWIVDETGPLLVFPQHLTCTLDNTVQREYRVKSELFSNIPALGQLLKSIDTGTRHRMKVETIREGDSLFLLGHAQPASHLAAQLASDADKKQQLLTSIPDTQKEETTIVLTHDKNVGFYAANSEANLLKTSTQSVIALFVFAAVFFGLTLWIYLRVAR